MSLHDPEEFRKEFEKLDAPEAIRNAIDGDLDNEIRRSKAGKGYVVENGELKQVEG